MQENYRYDRNHEYVEFNDLFSWYRLIYRILFWLKLREQQIAERAARETARLEKEKAEKEKKEADEKGGQKWQHM